MKTTCLSCDGTGLYRAPSSLGPYCFRCRGTGQVIARKPRPAKVRPLSPTRRIADICGGIPNRDARQVTLDYLGLTAEQMAGLADLWDQGVREVPRNFRD